MSDKKQTNCDAVIRDVARAMLDEFLNNPIFIRRLKDELKKVD